MRVDVQQAEKILEYRSQEKRKNHESKAELQKTMTAENRNKQMNKREACRIEREKEKENESANAEPNREPVNSDFGHFTCDICSKHFNSAWGLSAHNGKKHKVYHCEFCNMSLDGVSNSYERYAQVRSWKSKKEDQEESHGNPSSICCVMKAAVIT